MKVINNQTNSIVGFVNAAKETSIDQLITLIENDAVILEVATLNDKETGEARTVVFIKEVTD